MRSSNVQSPAIIKDNTRCCNAKQVQSACFVACIATRLTVLSLLVLCCAVLRCAEAHTSKRKGAAPERRISPTLPNVQEFGPLPPPQNAPPQAVPSGPQNVLFVQQFFTTPFSVDLVMIPATAKAEVKETATKAAGASVEEQRKAKEAWRLHRGQVCVCCVSLHTIVFCRSLNFILVLCVAACAQLTDGKAVSKWLQTARSEFERRFDAAFGHAASASAYAPASAVPSAEQRHFAMAALSNLVGGIGYFYGNSLIRMHTPRMSHVSHLSRLNRRYSYSPNVCYSNVM
jgi:hypothetical protein